MHSCLYLLLLQVFALEVKGLLMRPGWKFHLLHVQTRPIATSLLVANADTAALAFAGQDIVDDERVCA